MKLHEILNRKEELEQQGRKTAVVGALAVTGSLASELAALHDFSRTSSPVDAIALFSGALIGAVGIHRFVNNLSQRYELLDEERSARKAHLDY